MRVVTFLAIVLSGLALADAAAEAKLAFKTGEAAFARDDNVLALEQFRKAFTLAPHDAVRFNIAVCLERLGKFREAWLEYEIASKSAQLDTRAKKRASEQAKRVKERLGTLTITDPAGTALLDGATLCTVPCEGQLIDPGEHALTLENAEGTGATVRVTVERQQKTVIRIGTIAKPTPPPDPKPEVVLPAPPLPEVTPAPAKPSWRPGVLTYVGGGLALVGAGLFTWFGLAATASHTQYLMAPTESLRQSGLLQQNLANGALIGGSVGLVLALLDLLWLSR